MGVFGSSFQIGRSALAAYQTAVTITGQNIANVGNADYTRQSGHLAAMYGGGLGNLSPGTGVNVSSLERHIDEAVENRLRLASGARNGAALRYNNLSRVEALYNELTEVDLSTQLSEFFGSLANLQTDPLEAGARQLVISNADAVIGTIQRFRSGLVDQMDDLNGSATEMVRHANELAKEIASLNERIVTQEAGAGGGASALRDRRDARLRELANYMDIQVRQHANGIVNVYVGSEPLVDFNRTRGLKTETVIEDGLERVEVRFADNNGNVIMRQGTLAAVVQSRDTDLQYQLDQLDKLTQGFIYEINRVHSSGQGLAAYTNITGTESLDDATVALTSNAAGLHFPVQNGTFQVHVHDQDTGKTVTRMIEVDLDGLGNDMTLNDLVAAFNTVDNLSASVTPDNRLALETKDGYEVSFSEDSSGVLAAIGVGTFFTGYDADTIGVHSAIRSNPSLIATSLTGDPGDGNNAGRLAAVGNSVSDLLNGVSVQDFQESIVTELGVVTASAETEHVAADAVHSSLVAQRESISGVSLDEEAINLTKFERAYQGAARYVTVLESLSAEVMSLLG